MNFSRWIRWGVRLAVYSALGLLCVLLASRWWLPAVLPAVLNQFGAAVGAVERTTGGDLYLTQVSVDTGGASVSINTVQLPNEIGYLWECLTGERIRASQVEVGQVEVSLKTKEADLEDDSNSVYLPELLNLVERGLTVGERWIPPIRVGAVSLLDASGEVALARSIEYRDRTFRGAFSAAQMPGVSAVEGRLLSDQPWQVEWKHMPTELVLTLQIVGDEANVQIAGSVRRQASSMAFSADFDSAGWLPYEAHVRSEGFDLSSVPLPMVDWLHVEGLQLQRLHLDWDGSAYRIDLEGAGSADVSSMKAQPVYLVLSAAGDLETVILKQLSLRSEWADLQLSDPLQVNWKQLTFEGDARLQASFNLSAMEWIDATGKLDATLRFGLTAGAERFKALRFSLNGRDLTYADVRIDQLAAAGALDNQGMRLENASLSLGGSSEDAMLAGNQVSASGRVDFETSSLDLQYDANLGAEWVNSLLAQSLFIEPIEFTSGEISGDWHAPEIGGAVVTTLQSSATEAIELDGTYRLTEFSRVVWQGSMRSGGAEIQSEMTARRGPDDWEVEVGALRWSDPDAPELVLMAPAHIRWLNNGETFEERLQISTFKLKGSDLELSTTFDTAQGVSVSLKNVSLARANRWLRRDLPVYFAESIDLNISRFRPYLEGLITITAEEQIDPDAFARLQLSAKFEASGLAVENVALSFAGQDVLVGSVDVPIRFRLPTGQQASRFYDIGDGALRGRLSGGSQAAFGQWLEARTGIQLKEAFLDLELTGDLNQPVGHLDFRVEEIGAASTWREQAVPSIHDLGIRLRVDAERVQLEHLHGSINQSRIDASLQMPMSTLRQLLEAKDTSPIALLDSASGQISLDAWQMENWLDRLPPYFRRSGQLSGSLRLEPKLKWAGTLQFKDFGLRPTASLPAVDGIGGHLRLFEQTLRIEEAGASVGGSPVALSGEIDLQDWKNPRWRFDLQGENVPIARTTEMILRSDLDLRIEADDSDLAPLVAGLLKLRNSTLLVDFDPLAPSLQKGPRSQPPFFRISEEPFNHWRFDLKATGDGFMRVRSPYFKTKLSADLALNGTFGAPELTGSVRTLGGELHFPGAKFVLDDGEAFIEPSRPDVMQLDFSGIAQKASKVIVMEVSHSLDDPRIQFQSTPPMSQAEIVRFLATGSTTGGGVGNVGLYLGQGMLGAGNMNAGIVDKLSIDIGAETSRSGRSTLGVHYELTPRWSVEGEYDEFDAYNANLIWRLFKR